jgi:glycosyltransferase involved in cell wall biosynthesis
MNISVKKKIAVLMTGPNLDGFHGGIQTHVTNFIDTFSTSNTVEIRFFPVTPGLHNQERWGSKITRFCSSFLPYGKAVRTADIVHLNTTFDNRSVIRDCTYLLIARVIFKKRVVLQFHGGSPTRLTIAKHSPMQRVLGVIFGAADKVLLLSKIQGNVFKAMFPKVRYSLVPNYIDCQKFTPSNKTLTPNEPFQFLYMSRLHEEKGVRELVQASRILAVKGLGFKVLVCGEGPLKEWLVGMLTDPKVAAYLSYAGPVYGAKKAALLRQADVMLLPSYAEGFPYALLESSACGIALIATPVGAVPDVIVAGQNGLLVNPRDAESLATKMEYAVRNPSAIRAMGYRARQLVEEEFSTVKLKLTFEEMYEMIGRAR